VLEGLEERGLPKLARVMPVRVVTCPVRAGASPMGYGRTACLHGELENAARNGGQRGDLGVGQGSLASVARELKRETPKRRADGPRAYSPPA
jgi:hypothetical protein